MSGCTSSLVFLAVSDDLSVSPLCMSMCVLFECLFSPVCGKRYKNRPGLSYHYTHTHLAEEEGEENAERHALPFHRKNNHKREQAGRAWGGEGPWEWGLRSLGGRGHIRHFWKISSSAVPSPHQPWGCWLWGCHGNQPSLPRSRPGVIFLGLIYCFN